METTNNINFEGQEAVKIDVEAVVKTLKKISEPPSAIHHLTHNGCDDFLKSITAKPEVETPAIAALYGFPVYERKYVPLGELWMCDVHGRPLKKFKINL